MEGIKLNGSATGTLFGCEEPNRPGGQQSGISEKKLKKACADFESIFISYMLKTMRRTIPQNGLNKFPGKDIYATMIDQKVAEDLAKRGGGIGLQEILLRQLGSGIGGPVNRKP
ncbi:MAG: rod-binding protein [Thermodesulfobacteriota bacterium]|nr:rod-binding protein [Thermodesulfobacteriota bacterium]